MQGSLTEVYTVQGTQFQTIERQRAIRRARDEARRARQSRIVYLNNNPLFLIDRNGNLATA